MLSGSFSASLYPILGASAGIISILLCYYMSQFFHHEKPFPHTWISATADHYPQFIVFRMGTISGAVFLILGLLINHFWVMQIGLENSFRTKKFFPEIGLILGITGALFLMGSTANLDTGEHKTKWHVQCAVSFFLFSIFGHVYNSLVATLLFLNKLKGISRNSTIIKIILSVLTLIQMYLDLNNRGDGGSDVLGNTLEYSLAFSILGFLLITAWDVKDFEMVYLKCK